ncbi:MAG: hypothetical protein NC117_09715 [Pseudoflavonifractor sp.]|nr:hypothetical protein [Pseudoflavonifractor sp.]
MRDMFVLDWLFGHRKKELFWERNRRENHYVNDSHGDYCSGRDYSRYGNDGYAQQDFDDDLDSGMFDDF